MGELGGRREAGKGSKQWENEMMKPAAEQISSAKGDVSIPTCGTK